MGELRSDDPGLTALAAELDELVGAAGSGPFVVAVVGSVAVGKSTAARQLAERLGGDPLQRSTEVVSTDSFLLPNEQLEPLGGAMVKGHPQSYDWAALARFLSDAAAGEAVLSTPIYSHQSFDIVQGARHVMSAPDVLVVEGLNLLQSPPTAPTDLTPHLHRTIYLHAPEATVRDWFVARFLEATRQGRASGDGFYAMFAGMDDAEVEAVAGWTWDEINGPNLREHIEPSRARADVVVHKARDHSIQRIEHQRRS